ncbi:AarF/ABC1/UbiB kinase family protein [Paenibacillaceae bacterium]|nr:AarF/ABC1/UbiB kinase family protein [Paenibacillaceae bacterium]
MFSQLMLLAVVMSIIIGRLVGTKISFAKQAMAALLSVVVTTTVYWFTYVRHHELTNDFDFDMPTVLWLLSMVIASLIFYLLFEMFDPIPLGQRGEPLTDTRNPLSRLARWWRRQRRYIQVLYIALRNGVGKNLSIRRSAFSDQRLAVALRKTLEQCGGFFIKFGQVLSTRSDLLSPAFVEELSHLQENVSRLTTKQVESILVKELLKPKDELFSFFDMTPLAAASIGQVHRARLREHDQEVVVKLLRPDITTALRRDLDILIRFARWASRKSAWARSIGFLELAQGFATAMKEETDFRIEARNFAQVSAAMANSRTKVKIPHVYSEYSTATVLVLEYMEGASVKNGEAILKENGIHGQELQRQIFDCVLEQIFFSGVFHADPHPGNVYILQDGTPALLDFGSVGRLGSLQQDALKRLLIGFEQRNAYIIMDALLQLIEPRQEIDKEGLENAISQLLVQTAYNTSGGSDVFVQGLFRTISEFELAFYPMVAGAFRSLVTLEGTMLQLNPDFNLMEEIKRFAQTYAKAFLPVSDYSDLKSAATSELLELLPFIRRLPRRIDNLSTMLEKGQVTFKVGFFSNKDNASFITKWIAQLLLMFAGMAFGGISIGLLYLGADPASDMSLLSVFGYCGLVISTILLIRGAIYALRNLKQHQE